MSFNPLLILLFFEGLSVSGFYAGPIFSLFLSHSFWSLSELALGLEE